METLPDLADVERRLAQLEATVSAGLWDLDARMRAVESRTVVAPPPPAAGSMPTGTSPPPPAAGSIPTGTPPPPPPAGSMPPEAQPPPPEPQPHHQAPAATPQEQTAVPAAPIGGGGMPAISLEVVLRWVGVVLVVLAALFLVSTAISRGWIGPELQLLGAAAIGAVMLAAAVWLETRAREWAMAIAMGGAVVLTVSAGAAYSWLELVEPTMALGLVTVAAAVVVGVAIQLRMEWVAVVASAALLIVPTLARIIVDAPVVTIGVWLGLFAVAALVIGLDRGWTWYRVFSGWAVALWVLGLALGLAIDGVAYPVGGSLLVAVVAATIWVGPSLASWGRPGAVAGPDRSTAAVHRLAAFLPLWTWAATVLFADLADRVPIGRLGIGLAAGFIAIAVIATIAGLIERVATTSHLLGAAALTVVATIVLVDGPTLMVALAAQGLVTLVIGQRYVDLPLRLGAAVMMLTSAALLAVGVGEVIELGLAPSGTTVAHGLTLALLAIAAWRVERNEAEPLAELVNGVVWLLAIAASASVLAPHLEAPLVLVLGVVAAAVSLAAGRRLGLVVSAIGWSLAAVAIIQGATRVLDAAANGASAMDHLANLAPAAGLVVAAVLVARRRDLVPAAVPTPLPYLSWTFALGWIGSVLVNGPQGQMAVSAAWAVAAVGAIAAGVRSDNRSFRSAGLVTLAVVLAKLLTVDLAEVETLWRVVLFLGIGVGLLRLGYVVPRLAAATAGPPRGRPSLRHGSGSKARSPVCQPGSRCAAGPAGTVSLRWPA